MKRKNFARLLTLLLTGLSLTAVGAAAQSVAYRQTNLASNVAAPGIASQVDLSMGNSWGIAFQPGQSFFIANTKNGRVTTNDAAGVGTVPGVFTVSNPARNGSGTPVGIVADPTAIFGQGTFFRPFLMASEDGGISIWGMDANGDFPQEAVVKVDHSQAGAVYTAIAILHPDCCAPMLAVANFHSGFVETFDTNFASVGSFTDPNLPPGFAPYGMQVIGKQLFVTFAVQDAARHDSVPGLGNGIVSIFDLQGHFVRRFVTAGALNAPWGVTQASASFGPLSNDILIGNRGDGSITAFDPTTGSFVGQVKDGAGDLIVNDGLHGLAFRSDGFGDANTLYFTAGIDNGQDGLFGAITAGLVSTTRVSVSSTPINTPAPITVTVSAGPGNSGTPTGVVTLEDGGVPLLDVALINGAIVFPEAFDKAGTHIIGAQYQGNAAFLPSFSQTQVDVAGFATTVVLTVPPINAPEFPVTLVATVISAGGTPAGQIEFSDGGLSLGSVALDTSGAAILRIALDPGTHSLAASYSGDDKFDGSTSAPVTLTVVRRDFSVGATPPTATVTAGQSATFNIVVTPGGGFTDRVGFSCPAIAGITCSFNPPTVIPNGGVASTILTVTTSAGVQHFGRTPGMPGSLLLLASLGLMLALIPLTNPARKRRSILLRVAADALALVTLSLVLVSCGGSTTSGQTNRGTASIVVTAQSATISHTATVSVTVQ